MERYTLEFILIGILISATFSKRIRETIISLPMVYTALGLLIALLFPELLTITIDNPIIEGLAILTLVLVLASGSSRINLKDLFQYHDLPLRLLIIALPLTFVVGALVGAIIFPEVNIWMLAILAVVLAPIDSSLAVKSVNNPKVPMRIRQALNIEGGIDDGITLPFLLLFISIATFSDTGEYVYMFLTFTVKNIAFGILVGLIMGYLGARYISWGKRSGWVSSQFQKISWLALVLLTFGTAVLIDGNGYIAAFLFGIISGNLIEKRDSDRLYEFVTVENTLLGMLTFMFFGAVLLFPALQEINFSYVIYAILSLTLVRMLPVGISLIGTKLRPESKFYLGWFGPRGIASILYLYTILRVEGISAQDPIFRIAMLTILFSVVAHGMSAVPLSNWYAKRIAKFVKADQAQREILSVPSMPTGKSNQNMLPVNTDVGDSSTDH